MNSAYDLSRLAWTIPPEQLSLTSDEAHIWRAHLREAEARVPVFLKIIAPDERSRAEKFHFQKDRERFIIARGILREIIGRYLQQPPARLRFDYSEYGKPALAGSEDAESFRFNISHSHELALYAFTRDREIGLDVERIDEDVACEQIAERFFSEREVLMLRALPVYQRREAFFNCWTRKEAYIKARGEGLSLPLDRFDVSLAPGEPAALLSVRDGSEESRRWSLQELKPEARYAAAVAVEGSGWRLKCWQFLSSI